MSAWSHLANAKHIDRIIAHVEANYETWDVAVRAAGYAQTQAARNAVRQAVYDAAWPTRCAKNAVRQAVQVAAQNTLNAAWESAAAWNSADDAVLALVAWDYAGGLMDLPAEQVKVLAILGDQAAILMYSAIEAMETTQELA